MRGGCHSSADVIWGERLGKRSEKRKTVKDKGKINRKWNLKGQMFETQQ
jgi:hypothetical protein